MTKKINIIFIFILFILFLSCGFKKINQGNNQIYLQNINIKGDSRVAYLIKNDILFISNENGKNKYDLDLVISIDKTIKIKNKTGKVTRYNLKISGDLSLKNNDSLQTVNKSFYQNSNYDVEANHTDTINNEKNAHSSIVQQLTREIANYITIYSKTK
jgi:hypothetical protein